MIVDVAHSIELLLDEEAESRIRDLWCALDALGHRPPGSVRAHAPRPHCTLLAGSSIVGADTGSPAPGMAAVAQRLPVPVTLGAPIVFASRSTYTIAASVVPSAELLSVHATAYRLCGSAVSGLDAHCVPGAWSPHVTLARRVPADSITGAVALVAEPITAQAAAVRRWNGDSKTETVVPGRAC
ncbi:MAG: 2'-5' RNA ligase family protein [Gordonia sp. (in: high G+C Gram-positive bacteria)]